MKLAIRLMLQDKAAVEADLQCTERAFLQKVQHRMNISDAQVAEIKAAKEKLMQSAQKLFAKVYEQSQGCSRAQVLAQEQAQVRIRDRLRKDCMM